MSNHEQTTGLIGSTGFVGSNLARQFLFGHMYNSQTIAKARGVTFDLLVSAAPGAVKWKANKFPEEDLAMVTSYQTELTQLTADTLVMISTVDVYEVPCGVDEDTDIGKTLERLHPYGKHRFMLEEAVREHFAKVLVVRLPGLFGPGLKKNVIYDFMHHNQLENIHAGGSFQFYNLTHLWSDITIAREAGLTVLNITSEPVTVAEIAQTCFKTTFSNITEHPPAHYDVRSKHAALFGGRDGYLYNKAAVLDEISKFVTAAA